MPRQCFGKKNAKNLVETFVNHVGNGFGIPWHFAKGCDSVFLTVDTTFSIFVTLFTYNTLKWEKQNTIFLPLITLFWFFVFPCYNSRTHYPTLEKEGTQNITTCGNQDKQRELSYHCKQEKNAFGKITG